MSSTAQPSQPSPTWTLLTVSTLDTSHSTVRAELELESGDEYALVTVRLGVDADYANHQTSLGDLVIEGDADASVRAWIAAHESSVSDRVYLAA